MPKGLRALDPRIEMPKSRGPLPCFTETPGLSRSTSPTENAGLLSNWLRSMVVVVCPDGAWVRLAAAALAGRLALPTIALPCVTVATARARGGVDLRLAAVRTTARC